MTKQLIILFILLVSALSYGQTRGSETDTIRKLTIQQIEAEIYKEEMEAKKEKQYIDSIIKVIITKNCAEKLAKHQIEYQKYIEYGDSLISIVRKFNLTAEEHNYYLKVWFPCHGSGGRDKECDVWYACTQKPYIERVNKFGNKDGSSGNTYYYRHD